MHFIHLKNKKVGGGRPYEINSRFKGLRKIFRLVHFSKKVTWLITYLICLIYLSYYKL